MMNMQSMMKQAQKLQKQMQAVSYTHLTLPTILLV